MGGKKNMTEVLSTGAGLNRTGSSLLVDLFFLLSEDDEHIIGRG